ncbi:immunoglobulin-like domain-containing protein [Aurantibacillus circumpalustris]|uniref:immunoglobulin-like domain-containing protein n=1 Tax=Aurantibacillus circumpalustris TaxID=3036359 RepID=UPI00295BFFCF|nr:immunoglobulin-like domain-containing protein [Aurantibacillus circumpalustris]
MNSRTIISGFMFMILLALFLSCNDFEFKQHLTDPVVDTVAPVLNLLGKEIDTTYLQISSTTLSTNGASGYTWHPGNSTSNYPDPGAQVLDEINGQMRCTDLPLEVTGVVNNKFPGRYVLYYNVKDLAGNKAATVSRTVHVLENSAAFLNGDYSVTCNCTVTTNNANTPTVTTSSYTAAVVTSAKVNNQFKVTSLKTGPEYIVPSITLVGNSLDVFYYTRNYNSKVTTTALSPDKSSFSVEIQDYFSDGSFAYTCNNVYTKIKTEQN